MPLLHYVNKKLLVSVALLLALSALMLWRVVFRGDIYLAFDMFLAYEPWHSEVPGARAWPLWNERSADQLRIMYPINLFAAESWQQRKLPLWYPNAGLGIPALSEGIHQILYPVNLVGWWLLGLPEAIGWLTFFHLFLGGVFTLLFARQLNVGYFGSLIAAIVFSYSSFLMMWLNLSFFLDTVIWLPLVFLGLERAIARQAWRWTLLGVGALLLQFLAGSLQLTVYGLTGLGFYTIGRSWLKWRKNGQINDTLLPLLYYVLIVVLGTGLAAVQLLPIAELVSLGLVRGGVETDFQLTLRPLTRLLAPDFLGTIPDGHNMPTREIEAYLYIGILPLFFIGASLFSKRTPITRLLVSIGLLFLLVIYSVPPFYQLFYYLYPTFKSLGFQRTLYVVIFVWAVAAGVGADLIFSSRSPRLLRYLIAGGSLVGISILVYTLWLAFAAKYQERFFWTVPALPDVQPNLPYHIGTLIFALTFLAAVILLLWLWSEARLSRRLFLSAAIILLVLDLFLAHLDLNPSLPKYIYDVSPPSLTFLKELTSRETEPFRISNAGAVLKSNTAGIYDLPSIRTFDVFLLKRFDDYAELTGVRSYTSNFREVFFEPATNPLFNALNVKYIYANRADLPAGDWISVLQTIGLPNIVSNHSDAGEIKSWNIKNWTQAVILAPTTSKLTYIGQVDNPAVFETAIAIDPLTNPDHNIIFEIYVAESGNSIQQPVFSYNLDSAGKDKDRQWIPVTVPLVEFTNRTVEITLVTRSDDDLVIYGGWADPLIYDGSKYELLYYGPNSIYLNKNYLSRAWLVHNVTEVPLNDTAAAAEAISQPGFDPAVGAVIEGNLPTPLAASDTLATVRFLECGPSASTLAVDTSAPGLLVLSDIFYPGWNAYVDGEPQPIYATNIAMRGVYIPTGQHEVRFVYNPNSFRYGVYISLATLVIISGVFLASFWQARRQPS